MKFILPIFNGDTNKLVKFQINKNTLDIKFVLYETATSDMKTFKLRSFDKIEVFAGFLKYFHCTASVSKSLAVTTRQR